MGVPYAGNPYPESPHARRLSDLIRYGGNERAEAIRRQGALEGQMWADLGQIAGRTLGDYARYREGDSARAAQESRFKSEADDRARETAANDVERLVPPGEDGRPDAKRIAEEMQRVDPARARAWWKAADEDEQREFLSDKRRYEEGARLLMGFEARVRKMPDAERQPAWESLIDEAEQRGLVQKGALPRQYDPAIVEQTMTQILPLADAFKLLHEKAVEPPKAGSDEAAFGAYATKLGKAVGDLTFDEQVAARAAWAAAGRAPQTVTAPKAGTLEGYMAAAARKRGKTIDDLTPEEMTDLRRKWESSGWKPETPKDGARTTLTPEGRAAAMRARDADLANAEKEFRTAYNEAVGDVDRRAAITADWDRRRKAIQDSFLEQMGDTPMPSLGGRPTPPPSSRPGPTNAQTLERDYRDALALAVDDEDRAKITATYEAEKAKLAPQSPRPSAPPPPPAGAPAGAPGPTAPPAAGGQVPPAVQQFLSGQEPGFVYTLGDGSRWAIHPDGRIERVP